jgi:tRNA threonylcarbamoyl adenosine modification protein YjeE
MKKILIKNLEDMERFSRKFLENLEKNLPKENSAFLTELSGDLGSGKTTFVQNIGKNLKIKEKISSPTFTISKIYKIPKNNFTKKKNLIHIDAYRLGEKNSIKNIGLDEQLKNYENLIFIE